MKFYTLLFLLIGVKAASALYAKRAFVCGSSDYLTANNGYIDSHSGLDADHNYGKNLDCIWKIEAPVGLLVELVAVTFDLEDEPSCSYDWLELFDGDGTHASTMGKFCGRRFNPISSSQRFMTLQFITDAETQATGFSLFYNFTDQRILSCHTDEFMCANGRCIDINYKCDLEDDCGDDSDETQCTGIIDGSCNADQYECPDKTCISREWLCDGDDDCGDMSDELPQNCNVHQGGVCGESNHTGSHGTLASPNYPNPYLNNLHCIYYLKAPAGTQSINFHFDPVFDIESDEACSYDFLRVSSGDGTSSLHGPFCGSVAPAEFSIHGDHAYVVFTTDYSAEFAGFRLNWSAV